MEGKRAGVLGFKSCACPSHGLRRPGGHPANLRQESSLGPPQALRGNGHKATQSGQAEQGLQASEATRRGDQVECQTAEDEEQQAFACQTSWVSPLLLAVRHPQSSEAGGLGVPRVRITGEAKDDTEGWRQHSADSWGRI